MTRTFTAALTTSTAATIVPQAAGGAKNYFPIRLYLPIIGHAVSWSDNPIPYGASNNDPSGILPHHSETYTKSTDNVMTNGFGNSVGPIGKWELAITMRGNLQRVVVGTHIPTDATDSRGYAIDGNSNYLLDTGKYGMTGDQLRNELVFLASRINEITNQQIPIYYMYPHWRFRPDSSVPGTQFDEPHFFRGSVRTISVNDEAGSRENYEFTITFVVANPKPVS